MGALMRSTDWSRTVFGPVAEWPQSLRTAISILLESRFAMVVAWGPQFRFFYNDRYRPILGAKHPSALAAPGAEIIPEVWSVVGPEFERVRGGEAFAVDDWLVPLAQMDESPFEAVHPGVFSRDLAVRINELMADAEMRAAFGKAGRARAEQLFGWHAIAQQTQALYSKLLGK